MPGISHGQKSLVDYSPWGRKESETTKKLHFHVHLQSHQQCVIVPVSQHLYLRFFPHLFVYIYLMCGKWYIIVLLFLLYVLLFCTVSYIRNTHFFFFKVKHALVLEIIKKNCSLWLPVTSTSPLLDVTAFNQWFSTRALLPLR